MKTDFIAEPELEFGSGSRHVDVRFGLLNYGPLDLGWALAPKHIKLGIVGSAESIEGTLGWLERCRNEIAAKKSKKPNLFPRFPGFSLDSCFRSEIVMDARLHRTLQASELSAIEGIEDARERLNQAAQMYLRVARGLVEGTTVDVILCALPMSLFLSLERAEAELFVKSRAIRASDEGPLDFHDLLKAIAMPLLKPLQLILPMTYGVRRPKSEVPTWKRERERLQDEATRAWNFYTGLYYKAGGTPWRLARDSSQLTTCYIGVSFYRTIDNSKLQTSVAQVFNERGEGIIVRGGAARVSKEDPQPHLSAEASFELLDKAIVRYRDEHFTAPARVVLHKTSSYTDEECEGFAGALKKYQIATHDFLSDFKRMARLFRVGAYPPLRGTLWSLDDINHLLYTRGSVPFFETYTGLYVPRTLAFRREACEQTARFLAGELLALTKMNWNNTQFDGRDPITTKAAREVGAILKHIPEGEAIATRYSFYM